MAELVYAQHLKCCAERHVGSTPTWTTTNTSTMEINFFDKKLEQFILRLQKPTIAKILRTIDLLETFSHRLGMPHSKRITERLYELRIRGQQEIRILYIFHNNSIILLHGFIKKSQKIPANELNAANQKLQTIDSL